MDVDTANESLPTNTATSSQERPNFRRELLTRASTDRSTVEDMADMVVHRLVLEFWLFLVLLASEPPLVASCSPFGFKEAQSLEWYLYDGRTSVRPHRATLNFYRLCLTHAPNSHQGSRRIY